MKTNLLKHSYSEQLIDSMELIVVKISFSLNFYCQLGGPGFKCTYLELTKIAVNGKCKTLLNLDLGRGL